MAVISDTDVTNLIRYILDEASADFWADAEITSGIYLPQKWRKYSPRASQQVRHT
jgi:hypothetical protein